MDLAPEVTGAIVGGTIGIFSAAVSTLANYYTLEKRLQAKNQRRLAEFYLDKQVDAFSSIHAHLTECYATIGNALRNPSAYDWDRVKSEISPEIDAFEHAITVGDIYLSADQESELRATVDEYRSVADKVAILENGRLDMIDDVFDATEGASGTLAQEIAEPIRRLEGTDGESSEAQEEDAAKSRNVPGEHDSSNWAALATQRDRIRGIIQVTDDGSVEFLVEVEAPGRALYSVIGRRYAFERDLVESPTVHEDELLPIFDGSRDAVESFVSEAGDHLMSDDDEYYVEAEDVEAGIDWASTYVAADSDDRVGATIGE